VSETVDKRRRTELRSLLRTIEEAGWEYARVEIDGVVLVVSSDAELASSDAAGLSASTPDAQSEPAQRREREAPEWPDHPSPPTATESHPTEHSTDQLSGPVETVTSPTIGLFWRSPKPGAPPFVEVGDPVAAGETVCIIEVMKLMTHVAAPVDGTVRAIHIDNGSMVEHGTALIDIVPTDVIQGEAP
jgi:acetyl-CoA carboxylase biotin carboxyl carrier protein